MMLFLAGLMLMGNVAKGSENGEAKEARRWQAVVAQCAQAGRVRPLDC